MRARRGTFISVVSQRARQLRVDMTDAERRLWSAPRSRRLAGYKFIGVELDLVPVSRRMFIPDLRWLVAGGFVIVFLLIGWLRGALAA